MLLQAGGSRQYVCAARAGYSTMWWCIVAGRVCFLHPYIGKEGKWRRSALFRGGDWSFDKLSAAIKVLSGYREYAVVAVSATEAENSIPALRC